jgi:hypothetical protein
MWPRRFVIYTGRRSNGCLTGNILIISRRGNEACADCNKPPAMNGIGECVNPFSDPDGKGGWTYLLIPSVVLRNYADRYQWLMATALPMSIHNVQTIQIALPAQLVCNLILRLMIRILPVKQPLLRRPV